MGCKKAFFTVDESRYCFHVMKWLQAFIHADEIESIGGGDAAAELRSNEQSTLRYGPMRYSWQMGQFGVIGIPVKLNFLALMEDAAMHQPARCREAGITTSDY